MSPGAERRIDLLVPGLFGPVPIRPGDIPPLPALERLLSRADRLSGPVADPLSALSGRFGIHPEYPKPPPSAPYCRLADDPAGETSGYWLHADPVHLRPDRDQLLLFDARHLGLTQVEADALCTEINAHFGADGLHLEAPVPGRWYLRMDTEPRIRTRPLHVAAGCSIGPLMPEGEERARWAGLLNEVQMLLHHSPVNQARERAGRLTVSGVWPWGGGRLAEASPKPDFSSVYAEDPFPIGLARATGTRVHSLPEDARELLSEVPAGDSLIFWDGIWPAVMDRDAGAWVDALARLEHLADALLAAVGKGAVTRLDLDACDGSLFRITRFALRRFWRRTPAFGTRLAAP